MINGSIWLKKNYLFSTPYCFCGYSLLVYHFETEQHPYSVIEVCLLFPESRVRLFSEYNDSTFVHTLIILKDNASFGISLVYFDKSRCSTLFKLRKATVLFPVELNSDQNLPNFTNDFFFYFETESWHFSQNPSLCILFTRLCFLWCGNEDAIKAKK